MPVAIHIPRLVMIVFVVVLGVVIIIAIKAPRLSQSGFLQFRRKSSLLTENERQFFSVLESIVGLDRVVFAQVRLADFISATSTGIRGLHRITSRSVDFVVCDRITMSVIGCIELDDRSHAKPKRRERDRDVDAILRACGIPLVHMPAKSNERGYSADVLISKLSFLQPSLN